MGQIVWNSRRFGSNSQEFEFPTKILDSLKLSRINRLDFILDGFLYWHGCHRVNKEKKKKNFVTRFQMGFYFFVFLWLSIWQS
jgi:hypothetical protein